MLLIVFVVWEKTKNVKLLDSVGDRSHWCSQGRDLIGQRLVVFRMYLGAPYKLAHKDPGKEVDGRPEVERRIRTVHPWLPLKELRPNVSYCSRARPQP